LNIKSDRKKYIPDYVENIMQAPEGEHCVTIVFNYIIRADEQNKISCKINQDSNIQPKALIVIYL
jgi:hypothetical protein